MSTASLVREARKLITPPEAWTKGVLARDSNGKPIWVKHDDAYCFCIVGALERLSSVWQESRAAIEALIESCPEGVGQFNDTHTHEEALALLDKVADDLEGAE